MGSDPGAAGGSAESDAAVEARIAAELAVLARPGVGERSLPPPAYVRRYAVEHAAAGDALDERFLSTGFLPFVDAARLRVVGGAATAGPGADLLRDWRQIAYTWRWEAPAANADTLHFWLAACRGTPLPGRPDPAGWEPRWVRWQRGLDEVLARHPGAVRAATTARLPGGRAAAVVSCADRTLRVWDLTSGAAVGRPVRTSSPVTMLAVARLPDQRVVALTAGSSYGIGEDTFRMWDLLTGSRIGHVGAEGRMSALTATTLEGRPVAVTAGAYGDHALRVWRLPSGEKVTEVATGATIQLMVTASTPDGPAVVAVSGFGTDTWVRAWDLASGEIVGSVRPEDTVTAMAATRLDGRLVAVTASGLRSSVLRTWDLAGSRALNEFGGGASKVHKMTVAALPGRRTVAVTVDDDSTLAAWDLATGERIREMTGHTGHVTAVATAALADRRVLAISCGGFGDGTVRVWDLRSAGADPPGAGPSAVVAVATAVLPDRGAVVVTAGDELLAWDLATGDEIRAVGGRATTVATVVRADRRVVAVAATGDTVYAWDLRTGDRVGRPMTFDRRATVAAVDAVALPDGSVAVVAGSMAGTVRVWDLDSGSPTTDLTAHSGAVEAVAAAVLPGGRGVVVTGGGFGDATLRRWDLATGVSLGAAMVGHRQSVEVVTAVTLPDGRVLAASGGGYGDEAVRLWDLADGGLAGRLDDHAGGVQGIATTSAGDGRAYAATASRDGIVRVWDLATRRTLARPLTVPGVARDVALDWHSGRLRVVVVGAGVAVLEIEGAAT